MLEFALFGSIDGVTSEPVHGLFPSRADLYPPSTLDFGSFSTGDVCRLCCRCCRLRRLSLDFASSRVSPEFRYPHFYFLFSFHIDNYVPRITKTRIRVVLAFSDVYGSCTQLPRVRPPHYAAAAPRRVRVNRRVSKLFTVCPDCYKFLLYFLSSHRHLCHSPRAVSEPEARAVAELSSGRSSVSPLRRETDVAFFPSNVPMACYAVVYMNV